MKDAGCNRWTLNILPADILLAGCLIRNHETDKMKDFSSQKNENLSGKNHHYVFSIIWLLDTHDSCGSSKTLWWFTETQTYIFPISPALFPGLLMCVCQFVCDHWGLASPAV